MSSLTTARHHLLPSVNKLLWVDATTPTTHTFLSFSFFLNFNCHFLTLLTRRPPYYQPIILCCFFNNNKKHFFFIFPIFLYDNPTNNAKHNFSCLCFASLLLLILVLILLISFFILFAVPSKNHCPTTCFSFTPATFSSSVSHSPCFSYKTCTSVISYIS